MPLHAVAAPIYDLATGKSGLAVPAGGLIALGLLDDDWDLVSAPGSMITGDARVILRNNAWFAPASSAQWISSQSAASGASNLAPGNYVYQIQFDLSAFSGVFSLAAEFGSDNSTTSVSLNGNAVPTVGGGGFGVPWASSFATSNQSFFSAGLNTLQVTVNNAGPGSNPAGFVLRGTVDFEVSEPGTLAILGLGLLGIARVARRRGTASGRDARPA